MPWKRKDDRQELISLILQFICVLAAIIAFLILILVCSEDYPKAERIPQKMTESKLQLS
jgi:hypothetical protein